MVTRGCGEFCAKAVVTVQVQTMTLKIARRPSNWPDRGHHIRKHLLVIDHHTPGNAADRDGNDRLAALGIDDGDVVAETVGDIELALVARERDAPGAFADQDVTL